MAASLALSPVRARLAFRASKILEDAFVCKRCIHQQPFKSARETPFLQAFRKPGHYRIQSSPRYSSSTAAPPNASASPLGALSQTITNKSKTYTKKTTQSSSFPDVSSRSVAYWLLGSAASVFGIVVFGGLTRLTESGLSITEWRPVTGSLPPMNQEHWEYEYTRYKQSPEFKMLNSHMDLEDFKQIYWMEWGHRLWGRVVGITFLLPTIYFVARRKVSKPMAWRLGGICSLIGMQGVIGWWMVKSGLKDELLETGNQPRVSQYRLATHLGTAFVAYIYMLWNGLAILRQHRLLADPVKGQRAIDIIAQPALRPFRRLTAALAALVFTTAMSGALVAGLDAGMIYNDFPWMGQNILPPKREMLDPFYSHVPDQSDLWWRNMLENPVLVQLDHRVLATTTFTVIMALWAYSRFSPRVRAALPKTAKTGMLGVVHLVSLQVVLGITTLWYLVPTPLAAAHQAGALALLSGVFVLGSRVWIPTRTKYLVSRAASELGQKAAAARKAGVSTRGFARAEKLR
jgi:cytochrome c oxidase assembly protein subunit 15